MTYFREITGSRSLSVQQYSCGQPLAGISQKLIPSTLQWAYQIGSLRDCRSLDSRAWL